MAVNRRAAIEFFAELDILRCGMLGADQTIDAGRGCR